MKKAGYGGVKAGAIETMASVDGQIMPPVMGAAAFLMVEYVGIPYSEIVKHAFLPAILSYIGLFYIVHLEALKLGMQPMVKRAPRPWRDKALRLGLDISGTIIVVGALYYLFSGIRAALGAAAPWATAAAFAVLYFISARMAAKNPDLPHDIDINNPRPLDLWPTVEAGLHFLLPIGTLIWCLMIEEMSPALAAYWAIVVLVALMLTQRPLIAWLRGQALAGTWRTGANEVISGLSDGSRNMIGIGVATATAGIIVGGITLTGLGLRMTEFVEFVSQGNVMAMLFFIAFVCLVLGLGVPTTANYVLVATLMAPVVVELGAQSGLVIPLIAVHLFVFYYGIMGDITPPVGLATFAAAAISGEDAIETGIQGSLYALRTVILPFIWIFNPQLLLIDIESTGALLRVVGASTLAMLLFAAITMNWFRIRMKLWEMALLALAVIVLFRPDALMDHLYPEYVTAPPARIFDLAKDTPEDGRIIVNIAGTTLEGKDITKTVAAAARRARRRPQAPRRRRPAARAARLRGADRRSEVRLARAEVRLRAGLARRRGPGGERPAVAALVYLPALLLVAIVWVAQGRRMRGALQPA